MAGANVRRWGPVSPEPLPTREGPVSTLAARGKSHPWTDRTQNSPTGKPPVFAGAAHPGPHRAVQHGVYPQPARMLPVGTGRKAYGLRTPQVIEIALFHPMGNLPEPKISHRFCRGAFFRGQLQRAVSANGKKGTKTAKAEVSTSARPRKAR